MADTNLVVNISANTASAAEQISAVDARLMALEKSFAAGTASATAHTAAEGAVASSMARTAEAATGAGAAMEILDKHVRVVSMGMEAAGLEASSAAVRISALAEVVKTAEGAFGPLLVVMVAFEAAMKAADFFKEAGQQAMEFQGQLETLGASVETQGGKWDEARAGVEAWAAQEAMASGILQSQLIPALNDLVTAGHSLHDSQIMVAVAEEVAIAKHIDVRDVVRDLISAELGRARGLELLDGNVKKVVDSHGKMSDMLKVLHKDFEKAIEDDTSAERANARLKAEIEAVSLKIGNELLPMMRNMSYEFLGALKNGEKLGSGIVDSFNSIVDAARSAGQAVLALRYIFDSSKQGNNAFDSHWGKAAALFHKAQHESDKGARETADELFHGLEAGQVGRHTAGDAVKAHLARLDAKHGLDLDVDNTLGKPKEKKGPGTPGSSESFSYTPIDPEASTKTDEYTEAQKKLEAALKRVDDAEKSKAEAIKTATTTEGEASAQAAYDAQVTIDLLAKKSMLADALKSEASQRKALVAQEADQRSEEERYRQAYNEFARELLAQANAGHAVTDQQKNDLAELKAQHDGAKKAADGFASSIKTLDGNLRTNATSLGDVNAKLEEFKNKAEEAFGAASRAWETYQKKQAEAIKEDLSTANLSNAEKVAHYGTALARMAALDADYRAKFVAADTELRAAIASGDQQRIRSAQASLTNVEQLFIDNTKAMESADGKYTSSYKAAVTDRENAYKAFIASVQGYETTFLDGVLKKHQSLRDSVKDVFNQMLSDWVNHLEAMLLKSSLLKGLTDPSGAFGKMLQSSGVLAAPGSSTGNPQLDAAIAARITGEHAIVQSGTLLTTSHTQATTATNATTAALNTLTQAAQRAASAVGSGGGGGGGSLPDYFQNGIPGFDGGTIDVPGGGPGGVLDPGGWANSTTLTPNALDVNVNSVGGATIQPGAGVPTTIQKMESSAMQGLMIGSTIAGLTGGNSTLGAAGGALGGVLAAALHANPLISAGIEAVSGLLGSLFGPHLTQAQQPDIYNPEWGQADVDFNGAASAQTFNGKQYTAAAQYNVGDGGTPMYKLMEQWANSAAATTDNQKALQAQIKALEAGNPNADFGVTSEKNGIAYLANGQQISVTDLIALEKSYTSQVGSGPGSSSLFNLTRTYPDLNISTLQANGTYTPATTNGTMGSGGGGTGTGGGTGGGSNVNQNATGDLAITLNVDGQRLATALYPRFREKQSRDARGLTVQSVRSLIGA